MYRVLLVEDNDVQRKALKEILESYHENLVVSTSYDYDSAIQLLDDNIFDLFFLDIRYQENNVNDYDGLLLGKYIRSIHHYRYTPIIYVTSIPEKIQEALSETECFYYVLKPYLKEDILRCLENVLHSPLVKDSSFTFENFWGGRVTLPENQILYFCPGSHRRIEVHTAEGAYDTAQYTLNDLEQLLRHDFIRCHRKYLVNIKKIKKYEKSLQRISLDNGAYIPVGRAYKTNLTKL